MSETVEHGAVWLQGAGCSGCSVSLLNGLSPSVKNLLIDEIVPGQHVSLRFHATVMAGQGAPAVSVLEAAESGPDDGFILLLEGSVQTAEGGIYCTIGETAEGEHLTLADTAEKLGRKASLAIAIGTCAAYGGLPAAEPNPTGAMGLAEFFKERGVETPVVNIPGCPSHPDWIVGTIGMVLLGLTPEVDDVGRPKAFFGKLIHDNCPRRGYFDTGRFAKHFGDEGCLYELGCSGPYAYADCPNRQWNSGTNWPIKGGAPCMACVEPKFWDKYAPLYQKITEERMERFKVKRSAKG